MGLKKKQKHAEEEGGEAWLLPYSDLMTLLLAVFIVLFAVSQMDQTKAGELAKKFRESILTEAGGIYAAEGDTIVPPIIVESSGGGDSEGEHNGATTAPSAVPSTPAPATSTAPAATTVPVVTPVPTSSSGDSIGKHVGTPSDMQKLKDYLDAALKAFMPGVDTQTTIKSRGLSISFKDNAFFESGKAVLKNSLKSKLKKFAQILNRIDNSLLIEGHTDNIPIHTGQFNSNWQLSSSRAANVVQFLSDVAGIDGTRLAATGYGDNRPIATNKTQQGRNKNRRIDLIILYDDITK